MMFEKGSLQYRRPSESERSELTTSNGGRLTQDFT